MFNTETLFLTLIGVLLAGDGLIIYILKKRDRTIYLAKTNNRIAGQSIVLLTAVRVLIKGQDLLVDALHDKGVLNGNSVPIKESLSEASKLIDDYSNEALKENMSIGGC